MLEGKRDAYDGLIIDPSTIHPSPQTFAQHLSQALPRWHQERYRGIWLKIPAQQAHHIGHAVDAGFDFHHAESTHLMLTKWLPNTENKLPPNASHQVGVGAFVYDEATKRVLVVQEKNGPLKGKGVWKIPTGLVNQGEDITEAAQREVKEETGIDARFAAVLAMRQAHGLAFGKSDLFFVVAMQPVGPMDQQKIVAQEDEIEQASWISLEEYASIDFINSRPLLKKIMERCVAYAEGKYSGLSGAKLASGFSARDDLLLFGEESAMSADREEEVWVGLTMST